MEDYNKLKSDYDDLLKKYKELEDKLKLYTNSQRHKKYYAKNSDIVKAKAKQYMKKMQETNPEKLKQWRHTAYLNRKAKLLAKDPKSKN